MNDIDPSESQEESPKPLERSGEESDAPNQRKPLASADMVSGCLLIPAALLSAIFAMIVIIEQGSGWGTVFTICIVQIVGLMLIWRYLWKATSWGVVVLGILIAAGFYLLMFGICTSTL